jgi:hypothetical protein
MSTTPEVDGAIRSLRPSDVLCGRGSGPNDHPGNIAFRQIILSRKVDYMTAKARTDKARIAQEIVDRVERGCGASEPGRFLRKMQAAELKERGYDREDDVWVVVDRATALEKAKQALRQNRDKPLVEEELRRSLEGNIQWQQLEKGGWEHAQGHPIRGEEGVSPSRLLGTDARDAPFPHAFGVVSRQNLEMSDMGIPDRPGRGETSAAVPSEVIMTALECASGVSVVSDSDDIDSSMSDLEDMDGLLEPIPFGTDGEHIAPAGGTVLEALGDFESEGARAAWRAFVLLSQQPQEQPQQQPQQIRRYSGLSASC